jgi:hypothetical protein
MSNYGSYFPDDPVSNFLFVLFFLGLIFFVVSAGFLAMLFVTF